VKGDRDQDSFVEALPWFKPDNVPSKREVVDDPRHGFLGDIVATNPVRKDLVRTRNAFTLTIAKIGIFGDGKYKKPSILTRDAEQFGNIKVAPGTNDLTIKIRFSLSTLGSWALSVDALGISESGQIA
jgi:hypothetical protein